MSYQPLSAEEIFAFYEEVCRHVSVPVCLYDNPRTTHVMLADELQGRINFVDGGSEHARLRQILERMELSLLDQGSQEARGEYGLGSNNLLFMACELLLLVKNPMVCRCY